MAKKSLIYFFRQKVRESEAMRLLLYKYVNRDEVNRGKSTVAKMLVKGRQAGIDFSNT